MMEIKVNRPWYEQICLKKCLASHFTKYQHKEEVHLPVITRKCSGISHGEFNGSYLCFGRSNQNIEGSLMNKYQFLILRYPIVENFQNITNSAS